MADQTPNFNLTKDASTDYYNIDNTNANLDKIDKALGNTARFETAGGSGTAIILTGLELIDGHSKTFVVSANNNGAATNINGKPLYKPGTTQAPKLVVGKAITVWYSAGGNCFFIKASAEGNAIAEHVLAGDTFSNDDDTGIPGEMVDNGPAEAEIIELTTEGAEYTIVKGFHSGLRKISSKISGLVASVIKAGTTVGGILGTFTSDATAQVGDILAPETAYVKGNKVTGTMPDRGTVNATLPINGSFAIPAGKHSGSGKVTQDVPTKGAQIYTPGTIDQTIASGRYLSGTQTIKGDANLIPANILQGKSIFGVAGDVVAGKKFASGVVTSSTVAENISAPDGSSKSLYPFEVTGLDFTPRVILVHHYTGNQISMVGIYNRDFGNSFMGSSITQSGGTGGSWNTRITYPAHINETGFRLHGSYGGAAVTWQAFD